MPLRMKYAHEMISTAKASPSGRFFFYTRSPGMKPNPLRSTQASCPRRSSGHMRQKLGRIISTVADHLRQRGTPIPGQFPPAPSLEDHHFAGPRPRSSWIRLARSSAGKCDHRGVAIHRRQVAIWSFSGVTALIRVEYAVAHAPDL